jgi:hypothetical protein
MQRRALSIELSVYWGENRGLGFCVSGRLRYFDRYMAFVSGDYDTTFEELHLYLPFLCVTWYRPRVRQTADAA